MAKRHARRRSHSKHRARRNPHGTLLVNPRRHGGKSRHARRHSRNPSKRFSLKGLLRGLSGKRRGARKHRNPLVSNPRHRRRGHARRNSLLTNPLISNPRHRRRGHKRHNPLLSNPRHRRRSHSRRNPAEAALSGIQRSAQGILAKVPLLGGVLSGAVGLLGSVLGGALGVLPTAYAMPYVAKYIPSWLKPFGYTVAGAILASIIKVLPIPLPYKNQLSIGMAAAGGAVDTYRFRHGKSQDLGDEYGDYDDVDGDDEYGDDETGDYDDIGDDGAPLAATEYADADLADADYLGDGDLSDAEIAAAELGRKHFAKKFKALQKSKSGEGGSEGGSEHAGKPGRRHGWLIYWIGFDQFKELAKLPEDQRREAIEHMRREAKLAARKLLSEGQHTSVQQAEMSGLMVA